jgi:hypothetical protein
MLRSLRAKLEGRIEGSDGRLEYVDPRQVFLARPIPASGIDLIGDLESRMLQDETEEFDALFHAGRRIRRPTLAELDADWHLGRPLKRDREGDLERGNDQAHSLKVFVYLCATNAAMPHLSPEPGSIRVWPPTHSLHPSGVGPGDFPDRCD